MNRGETNFNFNSSTREGNTINNKIRDIYDLILDEDLDEALYELEELNKKYPNIVDVYHLKFKIYCIKENYNLAEKVIDKAEGLFYGSEKIKSDREYLEKIKISKKSENLILERYEDLFKEKEIEKVKDEPKEYSSSSHYYYSALNYRIMNKPNSMYYLEAQKVYNNMNVKKEKVKNYDSTLYNALYYKELNEYGKALKLLNSILEEDSKNEDALRIKIGIIKELKYRNN